MNRSEPGSDESAPEPDKSAPESAESAPGSAKGAPESDMSAPESDKSAPESDERWLVIKGRRWRRTDPSLPEDVVAQLKSRLGKARSAVRIAKNADDADALAAARYRANLAKNGLGERGPYWWDEPEADRLGRATDALREFDDLDGEAEHGA
jgi:hypothetical protein